MSEVKVLGTGSIDFVYRDMEFLKSLSPEVYFTDTDLKNGLSGSSLLSCDSCLKDMVIDRVKGEIEKYIGGFFTGGQGEDRIENYLRQTFNLLIEEPEISYLFFGQRCFPCVTQYRAAETTENTIESVFLSGDINLRCQFSFFDFSDMEESTSEIIYRGENNCDPFLEKSSSIGPSVSVTNEYDEWFAVEAEPSGGYRPAECALNAFGPDAVSDPQLFSGCPEFCDNGYDDDDDGYVDCDDPDCASFPACL